MKFVFSNRDELNAFIRLLQEIVIELESQLLNAENFVQKYEIEAKIEIIEEIYPKVARKQFNAQVKNSINITKALAIIIFQNSHIVVDVYAEMLKNRLVEFIHRDMI